MGFSEESDILNSTLANSTYYGLSIICNFHNSYIELCLKYPDAVNMNQIIRPDYHYFNGLNDYYKSKFLYNHINKNTNKLILDVYIIDNNYYINEEYILKILVDPKIQIYLTKNINFPEIYIHRHNINEMIYKTFDNTKYYILCSNQRLEQYNYFFKINYIKYKTSALQIIELTNSFTDIIDDLQDQISTLKMQVKDHNPFYYLGKHLYNK